VFTHINWLYEQAVKKLEWGEWEIPGQLLINTVEGKTFKFKYRSKHEIDVGDMYVGDNYVFFSVLKENDDLYEIAKRRINGFKYANDGMKEEISKLLPKIHDEHETADRRIMVVKKTPDVFLLRDVLNHFDGKMNPKHVAWIVSRLYNLVCYLKYAKIVHSGISIDSVFISPQYHSALLLGDWWYSTAEGSNLIALPSISSAMIPADIIKNKKSVFKIDLELVKSVGRHLLGDIVGSKLLTDKEIPRPLLNWLRSPSKNNAFEEYETWQKNFLIDSFGKRKFVELNVTAEQIYG
jgi:serine/threonine protein kinase